MSTPSPADLARLNAKKNRGLPQDFNKKDSEASTHKRSSTGARRTTRLGKDSSEWQSPKSTKKPSGKKDRSVQVNVTPSETSTTPSQKPPTPPSSGASASTVRSRRKPKSEKTRSRDSSTTSKQIPSKSGKRERSLGYRNQPLKGHEGLKALQIQMNTPSELVVNEVARDQLIQKIERSLSYGKGNNR